MKLKITIFLLVLFYLVSAKISKTNHHKAVHHGIHHDEEHARTIVDEREEFRHKAEKHHKLYLSYDVKAQKYQALAKQYHSKAQAYHSISETHRKKAQKYLEIANKHFENSKELMKKIEETEDKLKKNTLLHKLFTKKAIKKENEYEEAKQKSVRHKERYIYYRKLFANFRERKEEQLRLREVNIEGEKKNWKLSKFFKEKGDIVRRLSERNKRYAEREKYEGKRNKERSKKI